jgi:hypothetical protein
MVGWRFRVLLGSVLAVAAMFVLVSANSVTPRPATASPPGPPVAVSLVPPSPCPKGGTFERASVSSDSFTAGDVARAFAADWFGHRPAAAMALADPVFVNDARQHATGPRLPLAHYLVERVSPLVVGTHSQIPLYKCGRKVAHAALAVDVLRAGTTLGATIWVVKRPHGFRVWAVR